MKCHSIMEGHLKLRVKASSEKRTLKTNLDLKSYSIKSLQP